MLQIEDGTQIALSKKSFMMVHPSRCVRWWWWQARHESPMNRIRTSIHHFDTAEDKIKLFLDEDDFIEEPHEFRF